MARDSKIEVAAVNIRIPSDRDRNYSQLIELLAGLRRGERVYGDSYVAITYYNAEQTRGIISKYTELDRDGDWFNIDDFDAAKPEDVEKINIPDNLKPSFSQFYFYLDQSLHLLVFESYSESKGLSARSVERYFRTALQWPEVRAEFGQVEADIVQSYGEVEKILSLPDLKELRIIIRRPNPDDVDDDLAAVIEDQLKQQGASEYEEKLKAKEDNLKPNVRTKRLANVAAENGQVKAKSLVNGVLTEQDTADRPLIDVETFKPDEISEQNVFMRVTNRILAKVRANRAPTNE